MDNYNRSLREKLGLKDSIKVKEDLIETAVKTLGIEVVPYNMLDEKPQQLNNPRMPFPSLRFLPLEMVVQALIDTNGTIVVCQMSKTSGIKAFDVVVINAFQKTKFTPPKQHGQKVYTIMARPLKFSVR
ncbi:MAG: TonB family protein [bacterium]